MSHLLEVINLRTHFPTRAGLVRAVTAGSVICRLLIVVFVLALTGPYSASGQKSQSVVDPRETVRQFYAWYLHRLNQQDYNPLKNRRMALQSLTPEFLRRVPQLQREMEADIIVCSQDVDPAWEKSFKVEPAIISGTRAIVLLGLLGNEADTIKYKITLKRTRAGWRIIGVDCGD